MVAAGFSFLFCNHSNIADIIDYDGYFWINILLLSVLVMSFANTMYFFASSKIGAVRASSFIFIVPLTAIIFSKILLDEPVRSTTLTGGSLSIIAIYLINKKID